MLKIWLNKIGSLRNYNDLMKYGYTIDSINDKDLADIWNKVVDACIDIDEKKFIYEPKPLNLLESNRVVIDFFKGLYGNLIVNDLANFFDVISYRKGTDYKLANSQLLRDFEIGSKNIRGFSIEFYKDILTSGLIVHEFSHALYLAPIECVYDEVLSMTFEKIFANIHHSDLEILNSLSSFKSSYYEGTLKVSADTLKGKIKTIEKLFAKKYLVGYLASVFLLDKYLDDPETFKKLISIYRDSTSAAKNILDYYGLDFKSSKLDSLVDKDIEKVKKRMYS